MIRVAVNEDIKKIEEIYNEILDNEAQSVSYTNWQKGLYPTVDYAQEAINNGTMLVLVENEDIYGCVVLNHIQPKEYRNIDWTRTLCDDEVMVIHTLCISPLQKGKGYGKAMVEFCEAHAKKHGAKSIRLDTYEGNIPAGIMYPRLGYKLMGITKFHFQGLIWENLKCFEKFL